LHRRFGSAATIAKQFEPGGVKTITFYFSLYPGFANGIAEAIVCMGVSMLIYTGALYKVSPPVYTYGKVARLALNPNLHCPHEASTIITFLFGSGAFAETFSCA
jgi:hypothetical protein